MPPWRSIFAGDTITYWEHPLNAFMSFVGVPWILLQQKSCPCLFSLSIAQDANALRAIWHIPCSLHGSTHCLCLGPTGMSTGRSIHVSTGLPLCRQTQTCCIEALIGQMGLHSSSHSINNCAERHCCGPHLRMCLDPSNAYAMETWCSRSHPFNLRNMMLIWRSPRRKAQDSMPLLES